LNAGTADRVDLGRTGNGDEAIRDAGAGDLEPHVEKALRRTAAI